MNEIIRKVLEYYGYEKLVNESVEIFKSSKIDDYWVVYEGSPSRLLEKNEQSRLMSQCKELCSDPALEKNANIICLWCIDSIDRDTIRELHSAEENIYFFKKHVLYYTKKELNSFVSECSTSSLSELLEQSPTDTDVFQRYKSHINDGSWESLIYRICIKLTFIPIAKELSEDILNLYKNHEVALGKKRDSSYLEKLDSIALSLSERELSSEPDELIDIIMKGLRA